MGDSMITYSGLTFYVKQTNNRTKAVNTMLLDNSPFRFFYEFDDVNWYWAKNALFGLREGDSSVDFANYTYSLYIVGGDDPEHPKWTSNELKITAKQGTAKMAANPTAVQLYTKDRFSQGEFAITSADTALTGINRVELDAASKKLFNLIDLGNGKYALGYLNNSVPAGIKAGVKKNVKLSVYLEGNYTGKPNTTVSLTVNIK